MKYIYSLLLYKVSFKSLNHLLMIADIIMIHGNISDSANRLIAYLIIITFLYL